MIGAIVMDNSFGNSKNSIIKKGTMVVLGSDKAASLIRCNKGLSCACTAAKKRFIKTESNDSGGSFDCPYNAECDGTTVVSTDCILTSTGEKAGSDTDHHRKTCGEIKRQASDLAKIHSITPGNENFSYQDENIKVPQYSERMGNSYETDDFQYIPTEKGMVRYLTRSMSDSGRSTGSNELSGSEKTSLNGSRSSVNIRKSVLSLDMGIGLGSLESLNEKNFAEPDDVSGGNLSQLQNRVKTASNNCLNRTTVDLYVNNFLTRSQDTLLTVDTNTCSGHTELTSSMEELHSYAGQLSSNESSAGIERSDFSCGQKLVQKSPEGDNQSCSESCKSRSCLAGIHPKRMHPAPRIRRKRDFHVWENDLTSMCQDDSNLSGYNLGQYLDISPQNKENFTFTPPSRDSGTEISKVSPAKDNKSVDCVMHEQCLAHDEDARHEEFIYEQMEGSEETKHINQVKKTTKDCSTRAIVNAVDSTRDSPLRESPQLSNGASTSYGLISTTSTSPICSTENTTDIQPDITTTNASSNTNDVTNINNSFVFNQTDAIKSTMSECDLNDTNKQRGQVHTNCLKTVGTVFRLFSSPTKNLPNIFSTNKCKYDLELASLAYFRSCSSSPTKSDRHKRSMQLYASYKSASFSTPTSSPAVAHLKESPSSPSLLTSAASPARLSKRFRSFSVDACSSTSGRDKSSRFTSDACDGGTMGLRKISCQNAPYSLNGDNLLLDALFDAKKAEKNKLPYPYEESDGRVPKKAQQFGLSLHDIKNNTGRIIPLPVEETVEFLKAVGGDEMEGLFRRCARVSTMKEVQEKYDDGEKVDFQVYSDPHLAAAILKKFLRELQEPLMTYDLFEPITRLHFLETNKQLTEVQRILQDELPEDNYIILKYVFQFLRQVASKADVNHMTAENIATVFGPNIAWPKGQANLATVAQAVKFALILVQNFDDVFLR